VSRLPAGRQGTRLIGAANLSPVTKLMVGTCAVSRYNLSRSQKFIMVQDLNCEQMSVSGCNSHYEFVLGAGAKAKTVTSLLPQPTVLCGAVLDHADNQSMRRDKSNLSHKSIL